MRKSDTSETKLRCDVTKYMDDVESGKRVAGNAERLSVERHRRDLVDGKKRGIVFDWRFADVACEWFPQLTFPRGGAAGQPFNLHLSQKTPISVLFGWRKSKNNKRRFRRAYYSKARGQGKSPEAAGLAAMLFVADVPFMPGAEVVCCATKKAQSVKYVYAPAIKFMESIDELAGRLRITRSPHNCEFEIGDTIGEFYPLGRDSSCDGGNFHAVVRDELHAMRAQHTDFCETLETGLKTEQCLLIDITTAGNDHSVLWKPEYHYAKQVLNRVVKADQQFVWIFELDDDDDPFKLGLSWSRVKQMLRKSSPLLDIAVDSALIKSEWNKARSVPTKRNQFIRYRGNRMVSAHEKCFPPELWSRGDYELSHLDGRDCHSGLDLGWLDDLASAAISFETENHDDPDTPFYEFLQQSWIPSESPRRLDRAPFQGLIASGKLRVTDGDVTDHKAILKQYDDWQKRFNILSIAADPSNARTVLTDLVSAGFHVFDFQQSPKTYNEPIDRLTEYLAADRISHGGDELLAWAMDNMIVKVNPAGLQMPAKNKSIEKIDPGVALLMGFSQSLFETTEANSSFYEDNDMREVG